MRSRRIRSREIDRGLVPHQGSVLEQRHCSGQKRAQKRPKWVSEKIPTLATPSIAFFKDPKTIPMKLDMGATQKPRGEVPGSNRVKIVIPEACVLVNTKVITLVLTKIFRSTQLRRLLFNITT